MSATSARIRLIAALSLWFCSSLQAQPFSGGANRGTQGLSLPSALAVGGASPMEDDASLRQVRFLSENEVIAIGDRGVVWRSSDGGGTWRFIRVPTTASLRGVCFVTNRIGWVVGCDIVPYTRLSVGVVLFTEDGGESWQLRETQTLPGLHDVQFFGPEHGIAVGTSTAEFPTGIVETHDGGVNWTAVAGEGAEGWTAAAFYGPKEGIVAGVRGAHGAIRAGRLQPLPTDFGLPAIHDLCTSGVRGWMVGDGALVRRSENRGVSWPDPVGPLPKSLNDMQDFYTVDTSGDHVWIAGSPGNLIWHSPDDGATWERQWTGDAAPVYGVDFRDELHGCAVGAFGRISITQDGGRTWHGVRGGNRRPAILAMHAHETRVSFPLIVQESGANGYRSVVQLFARKDVGAGALTHVETEARLRASLLAAGGNDSLINWQLPLSRPDLDRDRNGLVAEWSRLTDQRLPQVLLGGLVRSLRMWRPEVLVLDEPPVDDAITRLFNEAVLLAIEQAADETRFPEQISLLGLSGWSVSKVFVRLPEGSSGPVTIDRHQLLPTLRTTVHHAARDASSRMMERGTDRGVNEAYALVYLSSKLRIQSDASDRIPMQRTEASTTVLSARLEAQGVFAGLTLPSGGETRRLLVTISQDDLDRLVHLAQHQRNFVAYSERMLDDPRLASSLLAQLRETTAPLSRPEGARLLADLADEYRRRSLWEEAEQTTVELIERYSEQPAAKLGMRWLLTRWSSQEINWTRLKQQGGSTPTTTLDRDIMQANFDAIRDAQEQSKQGGELQQIAGELPSPLKTNGSRGSVQLNDPRFPGRGGVDQRTAQLARRLRQAQRLADEIRLRDPALFAQADVQFLLASLWRQTGETARSSETYRQYHGTEEVASAWQLIARGEMWTTTRSALSPNAVWRCALAKSPPVLDGILGDPCWQAASAVELHALGTPGNGINDFVNSQSLGGSSHKEASHRVDEIAAPATVMIAYDDRYLYVAATVPRAAGVKSDLPQRGGRVHDADLHLFDRLSLMFDIDRDYSTYYRFDIDQRGATREALWEDQQWNPKWYVATDADKHGWRIEIAIPLEQLTPTPPKTGTLWSGGIVRTIPGIGLQSWTHPANINPRPETFGLIQFE